MSKVDDALTALESRDWSSAELAPPLPPMPMVVVATRLPVELVERLAQEAERRGLTPSTLLRQFAEEALEPVPDTATVRLVDVVRAVESLARRAA